ncbi:MAG: hypothetical protein DRN04_06020 [Thermoprotei archaeon]|nr:MAG: hypothetical protein DRN04_06020 [Thermoprotei archaeon]
MSEEIPWDKVAKEIIKILGTESARGLYYAFIYHSLYPMLVNIISQKVRGGSRVDEKELIEAVRQEVRKLQQTVEPQPVQPAVSEDELAKKIAQILRQMTITAQQPQVAQVHTIVSRSSQQPAALPELKMIEGEIKALEEARIELKKMALLEFNEEKLKKINERLTQIEQRLRELYAQKAYLTATQKK